MVLRVLMANDGSIPTGSPPAEEQNADDAEQGSTELHISEAADLRRELPVSTLLHLMGVPTAAELAVLEGKVDALLSKLAQVNAKVDRLTARLEAVQADAHVERIEFQLTEIRSILRKAAPQIMLHSAPATEEETRPKRRILSSKSTDGNKSADAGSSENGKAAGTSTPAMTDESFQISEGSRVRNEAGERKR